MALSKSDQAAVKKAGLAGGLSTSQATSISKGGSVSPKSTTPIAGSYGIDKKTGLPVGPENDPRGSAKVKPVTPSGVPTEQTQTPEVPVTAPNNALVPQAQQQGLPPGRTATGITTDPVTGQQFQIGANGLRERYQQGLQSLQQGGTQAPADRGAALGAVSSAIPQTDNTSAVDDFISQDPAINTLMSGITQLLNPQKQTTSLMQDYQKLSKQVGLDEINQELIDADTVINGTEDDIRNEIQTAGGFGTESQVQAMSLSRNKSLLKRYNQLVQMKTDATNQLNTLSSLNAQDKQMAQTRLNTQISTMFQLANFRQQSLNNVQEQSRWLTQTMGADGVYNAYKNDPRQLSFLEKSLGIAPGGMETLAAQAAKDRALDINLKQAQLDSANRANRPSTPNMQFVSGTANQPAGMFNPATGEFKPLQSGATTSPGALAQSQGQIDLTNNILKDRYLGAAVGPNMASRLSFSNIFTGGRTNFVANVEQLRQQLTLQNLQSAKANGATFGALSDSELQLLSGSATKLGNALLKDGNGNVTGYRLGETAFRNELDKINNFAKLDYVLKGGDLSSVGIVEHPDGTLWTMNSNGTMTEIR